MAFFSFFPTAFFRWLVKRGLNKAFILSSSVFAARHCLSLPFHDIDPSIYYYEEEEVEAIELISKPLGTFFERLGAGRRVKSITPALRC